MTKELLYYYCYFSEFAVEILNEIVCMFGDGETGSLYVMLPWASRCDYVIRLINARIVAQVLYENVERTAAAVARRC